MGALVFVVWMALAPHEAPALNTILMKVTAFPTEVACERGKVEMAAIAYAGKDFKSGDDFRTAKCVRVRIEVTRMDSERR